MTKTASKSRQKNNRSSSRRLVLGLQDLGSSTATQHPCLLIENCLARRGFATRNHPCDTHTNNRSRQPNSQTHTRTRTRTRTFTRTHTLCLESVSSLVSSLVSEPVRSSKRQSDKVSRCVCERASCVSECAVVVSCVSELVSSESGWSCAEALVSS